ncbi:MAG: hypothetical protein AMK73_09155 [Planctomycetes bacterium SM23_32]|nr:MAG: hypothetical protein AMK73_09155 [Planctomycetes bacterium SM23_32]
MPGVAWLDDTIRRIPVLREARDHKNQAQPRTCLATDQFSDPLHKGFLPSGEGGHVCLLAEHAVKYGRQLLHYRKRHTKHLKVSLLPWPKSRRCVLFERTQ